MGSDSSAGQGCTDFTGYFRLTKTDHLDEYLKVIDQSEGSTSTPALGSKRFVSVNTEVLDRSQPDDCTSSIPFVNKVLHVFLQAQGWPWVVRKTCSKFGMHATDIVQQMGQTLTITTLNAKGVWSRKYAEGKSLTQLNAAGVMCTTTAWWEGALSCRDAALPHRSCRTLRRLAFGTCQNCVLHRIVISCDIRQIVT